MPFLKGLAWTAAAWVLWIGVVFGAGLEGVWMSPVAPAEAVDEFMHHAVERVRRAGPVNAAIVLMERGEVVSEYFSDARDPIDRETVFPAASLSKWIAAYAMMTLVQEGRAGLDVPVSSYLSRWQLPPSEFGNDGVTIRRLLSHTAGFEDGLGFGDYASEEQIPSLEASLSAPRASSPGAGTIAVTAPPGEAFRYSGGGYLLLELLVEELSGRPFAEYVEEAVFAPLAMSRASYAFVGDIPNRAGSLDEQGESVADHRYASKAATGLSVSADDLVRFVRALVQVDRDQGPLTAESLELMRTPHGRVLGADVWGLGTILYAPVDERQFVFGHDGANDPAINSTARIHPVSGDALIVLVIGDRRLATALGSDWVLWQTGRPDVLAFDAVIDSMVVPGAVGASLIVAIASIAALLRRRRALGEATR